MSEHDGKRADPAAVSPLTPASTFGNDEADPLNCIAGRPAPALGGLQQPKLVGDNSTSPLPQSGMSNDTSSSTLATTNQPPPSLGPRSSMMAKSTCTSAREQGLTNVSMRELVSNPLEDEAENAIVRAIEARERKEKAEGNDQPAASGIFSGVSDAALKIVLEEESDNDSGDAANTCTNYDDVVSYTGMSGVGGPSPSSPRTRSPTKSVASPDEVCDIEAQRPLAPPELSRNVAGGNLDETFDIEAHRPLAPLELSRRSSLQQAKASVNTSAEEPASALKALHVGRVFAVRCQNIFGDISASLDVKVALKVMVGFLIVPSMLVSAILFYAAGNPMSGEPGEFAQSSISWWILFIGARQVCTLSLSKLTEVIVVDVMTLKSRTLRKLFGPWVSLLIIQARGWPYIVTFWAVWNFALLQGRHSFAKHWLFYTNISWFSECSDVVVYPDCNPAGSFVYSDKYTRFLIAMIVFGAAASIKRNVIALYQGKRSTEHYGPQLQKLMEKMLTISELSQLADEIEAIRADQGQHYYSIHGTRTAKDGGLDFDRLRKMKRQVGDSEDEDDEFSQSTSSSPPSPARSRTSAKGGDVESNTDGAEEGNIHLMLNDSAKTRLVELLDAWEEPAVIVGRRNKKISVKDVLSFRQATLCLDSKYPFSYAFGPANTRERCIESAYVVYQQLLMHTPGETVLPFDTLALIAVNDNGDIDEEKARKLIRRFRPSRDGSLGAVDFVRSVDKVYKEVRTLRASLSNSSQLYLAMERLVNVAFYFVLWLIVLTIVNLNPWALFVSLSGVILSFAFLFGKAGSSIFIGIIFILVQKPYDIGDKIHISNANVDTSPTGSPAWFVDGITLFSTTVRRAATNEVATHSNGSLADSRIINANRSPQAIACVYLKFSVDVPYDRIMFFKTVVEAFVKDRPTEWISFLAFRATRIEADLGFIEYVVVLQHVEKWQNGGPIAQSKADVASFCLEAMKKLDMRFCAPPKPINLNFAGGNPEISSAWEALRTPGTSDGPPIQTKSSDQDFSFLASLFAKPGNEKGAKKRK